MRRFGKYATRVVLLGVLALFGATGTAVATPSCEGGLKIEPVLSGQYGPVSITVDGSSFSFTTGGELVTSVVVKGGPGFNLYSYPAPGVTSDSGLTAPTNPKTGNPYGLSHLCFFTTKKGEDPK